MTASSQPQRRGRLALGSISLPLVLKCSAVVWNNKKQTAIECTRQTKTRTERGKLSVIGMYAIQSCCHIDGVLPLSVVSVNSSFAVKLWVKHIGATTVTFGFTWGHQLRKHSIRHWQFPIGCPLEHGLYVQPFSIYWALSILGDDLDLSSWRDIICHVTIRRAIAHFLLYSCANFKYTF